jgi:hypothetical protein
VARRLDGGVVSTGVVGSRADEVGLVCASLRGEGRGSGARLEGDIYQCVWLRHGRLLRVEDHLTLSGALHALGLVGGTLEAAGLRQ